METCKRTIKHSEMGWGIVYKTECDRPVFKDGFCKKHYNRIQEKLVNWGDRPNYRPATQEDIDKGRSLKLRNTNEHRLYRCRKGVIEKCVKNIYSPCDLPANPDLFCVKTL